jgi:hypothetical protein
MQRAYNGFDGQKRENIIRPYKENLPTLDQDTNIEYDSRTERSNIVEFEPIKPKINKLLKE